MPKVSKSQELSAADALRFHGLQLGGNTYSSQASCECPWCGRDGKFYVNEDDGRWECKVCGEGGNVYTFIRKLHEEGMRATSEVEYRALAEDRGFLEWQTLVSWEVCKSVITDEWLVPGYGVDGKLNQLHRYAELPSGKRVLLATPGCAQHIFGLPLYNRKKKEVWLCEGCWDGMALWEMLRIAKKAKGDDSSSKLAITGSEAASLLADANVLATPGCNVFRSDWEAVLGKKRVILPYDNDHSKTDAKTGNEIGLQGYKGAQRAAQTMSYFAQPPLEVAYLEWGPSGYDSDFPSGFDIRDALKSYSTAEGRLEVLGLLLEKIKPTPATWISEGNGKAAKHGKVELEAVPCRDWRELENVWRKALKWTPELSRALSIMLACVLSTEARGEQLWLRVLSPPSTGKTTLCEALAVAKQYIHCRSELGKLYSGYKADSQGKEDFSIIPHIKNKTLVVKDIDPLLKSPQRGLVLGQLRDLYDGAARSHFNNGTSRNYENTRSTVIICGTGAAKELDTAELGARFIDVVIMSKIDPDLEREVNRRVAYKAFDNIKVMANGHATTYYEEEKVLARQMTGGYVIYLRENAQDLLSLVEVDEEAVELVMDLGEFVAHMRARPSSKQQEVVEREFSARLVEQYARLTSCLTVVLGKTTPDREVLSRVAHTALDTAAGKALDIVKLLYAHQVGLTAHDIADILHGSIEAEGKLLQYMCKIGAVALRRGQRGKGGLGVYCWHLSRRMLELYERVMAAL